MSPELIAVIAVIAVALLFDYTNGFHDAANAIATSVSTRALTPRAALLIAALGNFIGAHFGAKVAKTVGDGLVTLPTGMSSLGVVFAGVVGAILWNVLTWYFGIPSSSSHALFGGLVGATLFAAGGTVQWANIGQKVLLPMVLSPLVGILLGAVVMFLVLWAIKGMTKIARAPVEPAPQDLEPRRVPAAVGAPAANRALATSSEPGGNGGSPANPAPLAAGAPSGNRVGWLADAAAPTAEAGAVPTGPAVTEPARPGAAAGAPRRFGDWVRRRFHAMIQPGPLNRFFRHAQTVSATGMAIGHGMQDAAKTMGVIVLALYIGGFQDSPSHIPEWVYYTSATVLALGTYAGGWRIIRTLGRRIIHLRPPEGFAAETVASSVLYFNALALGAPISTTHTITSAIMGVGATKKLSAVRWGVAGNIVTAWVLTFPGAAAFAIVAYFIIRPIF